MTKGRFIELLNLYLDGELDAETESELMEAMDRHVEYKAIYIQYCRINKACAGLGLDLLLQKRGPTLRTASYAIGGLAAAFAFLVLAGQNIAPVWQARVSGPEPTLELASVEMPPSIASEPYLNVVDAPVSIRRQTSLDGQSRAVVSSAASSRMAQPEPHRELSQLLSSPASLDEASIDLISRAFVRSLTTEGITGFEEALEDTLYSGDPFNAFDALDDVESAHFAVPGPNPDMRPYEAGYPRLRAVSASLNR